MVGEIGVAVGGMGVFVGGTGVLVGGIGVLVGGIGVAVGGMGVSVGNGVSVGTDVAGGTGSSVAAISATESEPWSKSVTSAIRCAICVGVGDAAPLLLMSNMASDA